MLTNSYLNAIRNHVDVLKRRGRIDKLIVWEVTNDEVYDPTLIAMRVYGNRDDVDVIMLCAGTNRIGEAIPKRDIYLPLPISLMQIKNSHNRQGRLSYGD